MAEKKYAVIHQYISTAIKFKDEEVDENDRVSENELCVCNTINAAVFFINALMKSANDEYGHNFYYIKEVDTMIDGEENRDAELIK